MVGGTDLQDLGSLRSIVDFKQMLNLAYSELCKHMSST
jgi:hypothetical protein